MVNLTGVIRFFVWAASVFTSLVSAGLMAMLYLPGGPATSLFHDVADTALRLEIVLTGVLLTLNIVAIAMLILHSTGRVKTRALLVIGVTLVVLGLVDLGHDVIGIQRSDASSAVVDLMSMVHGVTMSLYAWWIDRRITVVQT